MVKPDTQSETSHRTEAPETVENGELPWWRNISWRTVILVVIILQFIIRFIAAASKG
jgi:hypothetical protein